MKTVKEIYIRTVILQCLTNRVSLEMAVGAAKGQSLENREEIRNDIRNWIRHKGYDPYITAAERRLFELPVGGKKFKKDELLEIDVQCKAMEVFLWALNKTDVIPDLSFCEIGEYHRLLGISKEHEMEEEVLKCRLRPESEIRLQADIAFLWNWRINEVDMFACKGRSKNITDMIAATFGTRYDEALKHIPKYIPTTVRGSIDFVAWDLVIKELYKWQMRLMKWFTYWRYYAFMWMMGDEAWDEVRMN